MNRNFFSICVKRWGFVFLALVLVFSMIGESPGFAAPGPQEDLPGESFPYTLEFSFPEGEGSFASDLPLEYQNPKLDYSLANLAMTASDSPQAAADMAEAFQLRLTGHQVEVFIVTSETHLEGALKAVADVGGEVSIISNDKTLLQAWLPIDALAALTTYDSVYYVQQPILAQSDEPIAREVEGTSRAISEGLAAMNAPAWHAEGFMGAGVKVAIIDGGFTGYFTLLGTDLPETVNVRNFRAGEDPNNVNQGGVHGTAVAEIVYDIAPEAEFYLARIGTTLELAQAVDWAIDNGVQVINTSLGFYNVGPGDGTGFFADVTQKAHDAGILWVKSAGNSRQRHWAGPYNTDEGDIIIPLVPQPANTQISYIGYLRWDDWEDVVQDYALCMVRWTGSAWQNVSCVNNPQNGGEGQTPTEMYFVTITVFVPIQFGFKIERRDSDRDVNFGFFSGTRDLVDPVHDRSITEPGDQPAVMTVGAIDFISPYDQKDYSSQGPTNGPGGTPDGGSIKPDIAAYAGVETESYANPFEGTSASAPHVAGAAVLVLSANPGFSPDQVQTFLEERAQHLGTEGKNSIYGYGQLYLGDPATLPGAFGKAEPADEADEQSLTPTLSWEESEEADRYEYCFDTSDDDACADDEWVSVDTETTTTLDTLDTNTTYYWQVRAVNQDGNTYADDGAWWSFTTVDLAPPGDFSKTAPADGATDQSRSPTLSWGSSDDAASYEYCFDTSDNDTCDGDWVTVNTDTTVTLDELDSSTTYYWQVRAVNPAGTTYADGDTWWSFTTEKMKTFLPMIIQ